jgi:succinate dehydrogenase / fumarate reductase cytochrome b subunit
MQREASFLGSTVGRKIVMAVTGLILFGFVVGHMAGNMQVYLGAEALNAYAEGLRHILHGAGIWIARGTLLAAAALHVWAFVGLSSRSMAARAVGYREKQHQKSTFASRTMRISGIAIAAFVVYHLLHLTTGSVHPDFVPGDAYHNFVAGFQRRGASAAYIVAMLFLGLHLWHGVWSVFQTLGLSHPRYRSMARGFASAITFVIVAGNLSFPIAVLTGLIQ